MKKGINLYDTSMKERFLRRWKRAVLRRKLGQQTPVIVYQMGKVGSLAVVRGLQAHGVRPVFHAHCIYPARIQKVYEDILKQSRIAAAKRRQELENGLDLYYEVIARQRPTRFISLVREPIGRNVSAFFQNLDVFFPEGVPTDNLHQVYTRFLERYPHDLPLTWFEEEFQVTLGIDVYAEPFPREEGALRLKRGPFEVLLLKMELPGTQKDHLIADFLGLDSFAMARENVGAVKGYGELYQRFKATVALPASYLDRMAQARYMQHFYTDEEINAMVARWSPSTATQTITEYTSGIES